MLPAMRLGGAEGIRTPDLLIANETRYQLRHSPKLRRGRRQRNVSTRTRRAPNPPMPALRSRRRGSASRRPSRRLALALVGLLGLAGERGSASVWPRGPHAGGVEVDGADGAAGGGRLGDVRREGDRHRVPQAPGRRRHVHGRHRGGVLESSPSASARHGGLGLGRRLGVRASASPAGDGRGRATARSLLHHQAAGDQPGDQQAGRDRGVPAQPMTRERGQRDARRRWRAARTRAGRGGGDGRRSRGRAAPCTGAATRRVAARAARARGGGLGGHHGGGRGAPGVTTRRALRRSTGSRRASTRIVCGEPLDRAAADDVVVVLERLGDR